MARFTLAYSHLLAGLDEVEALRKIAGTKEKTDPIRLRNDINATCRGAIVLLCSHVEAFIKTLGELGLDSLQAKAVSRTQVPSQLFYHISKDILDEIKDTSDPLKISEKVFQYLNEDSLFWSKVGVFPQPIPADRFNKGFSNPAYPKIRAYFNRFGYGDYDRDLARKLRAKHQVTINTVNHLVDTRNKIAHGNASTSKTPAELKEMMHDVKLFCGSTDTIFASWWKKNFCAIRK